MINMCRPGDGLGYAVACTLRLVLHASNVCTGACISEAAVCRQLNGMLTGCHSLAAAHESTWVGTPLRRMGQTIMGPWSVVVAGGEVQQGCLEGANSQGSADAGEQRWAGCNGVLLRQQNILRISLKTFFDINMVRDRSTVMHTAHLVISESIMLLYSQPSADYELQRQMLQLFPRVSLASGASYQL